MVRVRVGVRVRAGVCDYCYESCEKACTRCQTVTLEQWMHLVGCGNDEFSELAEAKGVYRMKRSRWRGGMRLISGDMSEDVEPKSEPSLSERIDPGVGRPIRYAAGPGRLV